jgi:hypothetical protein
MTQTKYGKYVIREPIEKGRMGPNIHLCAEEGCIGAQFPDFPAEQTMIIITEPTEMNAKPHAHDYDQFLCFLGPNPLNFFEFDAEIEISLGEEGEKHIVDTTSIVYVPKGLFHCPIKFKRVDKPVLFMHTCFAPEYSRSEGDTSGHPPHSGRIKYTPEEAKKLRGR